MEIQEERLSRAISATSRRQILQLLTEKEYTVKEISIATKMSVSLASRHLKLLYDLGFLNVRKKFPNKFYSLKVKELKNLLIKYGQILSEISGSEEEKEEKLARAVSAGSRRQILRLLVAKKLTVKDISITTEMSVSLASRHLKMLHDLGFLNVYKKFPNKFYSLKIKQMQGLLESYDAVLKRMDKT